MLARRRMRAERSRELRKGPGRRFCGFVVESRSLGSACGRPSHQLVEPRQERSRAEALEDRPRVVDGGLDDGVVGPQHERHVQDHVRLLVGEAHLGELGEDRRVLLGSTLAVAVVCAEGGSEGSPFEVKDAPMEVTRVKRSERLSQTLEITLPERGARGAREVHRRIREIELGRPAKARGSLAIPSGRERGGGPARHHVGLLLGVLAVEHQALVLGEQVIDRHASRGQDLLAAAQDGRTVLRSQVLDVCLVRRGHGPIPLAEVNGDLGGVGECDGVAVPEPEPAGQVERRIAALE